MQHPRTAQVLIYAAAGLAAPFLWTLVEMYLIAGLPLASSTVIWCSIQSLVGFVAAILLVGPLVILVRPYSPHCGFVFIVAFLVFESVAVEHSADLLLLFELPDTWVFLGTSLGLIWWASPSRANRVAA